MNKFTKAFFLLFCFTIIFGQTQNPPIYIAFHWHMHQPIYWPYETVVQTAERGAYSYNLYDIFNSRTGPYTSWPKDAVLKGINQNMGNFGAQVSFSGSLIENLNNLEANGNSNFNNWKSNWNYIKTQTTTLGNPRIDMVAFGYHHPLMGLIGYDDIRKQIQKHKKAFTDNFSGSYSKGIFPPENAFNKEMIPALVDEGLEWVMVDNVHFDRASNNYPFNTGGNLYEPNKADIRNSDPNDWVQLNGLWAPTKVSARWGHTPHFVEYVDPATGQSYRMIAVPTSRYLGNEDGRGGFGALNYDSVISQLEAYNTDPEHPILVVLHHDGDNYGGGTDSYYGSNFQNFVNWLKDNPSRFVCTTVQDYLEMYPPAQDDVIHVEAGSWSGADNGDPEFLKWNGDPDKSTGYSPDRNSWGIVTAAKNIVATAEQLSPGSANVKNAWEYLMVSQTSCYWYWDNSENGVWDSHPARACNQAVSSVLSIVQSGANNDLTGPSIYHPQRNPYNPGGTEWGIQQSSDVNVWTYIYDYAGVSEAVLKYRIDKDGVNSPSSVQNETFEGGAEVNEWISIPMNQSYISSTTNPSPTYKASEYAATITDLDNALIDYYVEATDAKGNISRSSIQHVWIGNYNGGGNGGNSAVSWTPEEPGNSDVIKIKISGVSQNAKLHWGVNAVGSTWKTPNEAYRPAGTVIFGSGPAVETPFIQSGDTLELLIGPFNNAAQKVNNIAFVIHYSDETWDNNGGNDYLIVLNEETPTEFVIDGNLDDAAGLLTSTGNVNLYAGYSDGKLYVATNTAQSLGKDMFLFASLSPGSNAAAPWAKAGQVAEHDLYLANESSNSWAGVTGNNSSVQLNSGNVLEAVIDLNLEYSSLPDGIYLAAGAYQTSDNGALEVQVPAGNGDGNIDADEFYYFELEPTTATDDAKTNIVSAFKLEQNYPNPFNPSTLINFSIDKPGFFRLNIYNILGELVETYSGEAKSPGNFKYNWNASGKASGIYFARLETSVHSSTIRMLLIK